MRASWIAALVLIGCGPPPPPEPLPRMPRALDQPEPEPPRRIEVELASPSGDQLREVWWSYPIDGSNYQTWLQSFAPHLRAPMAEALLREGGFRCEAIVVEHGCERTLSMATPAPSADLRDPCLRRYLASWALDQISDPDVIATLFNQLIAMVRMPAPETELGEKAIQKLALIGEGETALWEADDAGNDALVDRHVDLLDDHALFTAIVDRHIDAAYVRALPTLEADSYALRFGAESNAFRTEARLAGLARIAELLPDADERYRGVLLTTLRGLAARTDCTIAGAAAGILATEGEPAIAGGPFRSPEDLLHSACQTLAAVGARGPAWKQLLTPHALTVTNHLDDPGHVDALWTKYPFAYDDDDDGAPDVPEADADHDGVPSTRVEVQTLEPGRTRTVPFADELQLALPHCDDAFDCAIPGTSVHFQLDIRKERGTKYRLHALHRFEHVGFDC